MLPYYSIDEIAQRSGLSRDQVLRLGCSGTLVFSIVDHTPKNYEEVEEVTHENGSRTVRTKTKETTVIVRPDGPPLRLKYIGTEDTISIIRNDAPNRWTLVRGLYSTRELNPKTGTWHLGNPRRFTTADLVVAHEEWEHFANGPGKQVKHYLPLAVPEKVTLLWLVKNLSIANWVSVVSIAAAIFGAGIYFTQTNAYQEVKELLLVSSKAQRAAP